MNKLKITVICVTLNNGELIAHSISSIINFIDEILIYDDSKYNDNYHLYELENKYKNIKIIKKDLGKKNNI